MSARTLITRPEALLLDEPTSAVDAAAARLIEQAARRLAAGGVAVLWVTHDAAQVERVADRVLRIEHGRCAGLANITRPPRDQPTKQPTEQPTDREAGQ